MTHAHPDRLRRALLLAAPALLAAGCGPAAASALPAVTLPGLPGLRDRTGQPVPGIEPDTFRRGFALLNIWASWCPYCRSEHGILEELAGDRRLRLVGLVWQDKAETAAAYLAQRGNPFHAVALDADGVIAGALRQRGVPSSYLVDGTGAIIARHPGALTEEWVRTVLKSRLSASI
ncbi:redoxin family protein [Salinarimonas soli]|nr:redoxin family protein [Salinarimonas soli]